MIINKVGCALPMVVVSILLNAEFGGIDHREDAPHFRSFLFRIGYLKTESQKKTTRLKDNGCKFRLNITVVTVSHKTEGFRGN